MEPFDDLRGEHDQPRRSSRSELVLLGQSAVGRFVYSVLTWLLLAALLPMVWGWQPSVISSGSMAPAIRPGDVLVSQAHSGEELGPGSVVVYQDPVRGDMVAHRIQSVNAEGRYVTRGDANGGADSTPVDPSQVEAIGRMVVPYVGLPAHWLRTGNWAALAGFVGIVIASVWLGHRRPRGSSEKRRRRAGPKLVTVTSMVVLLAGLAVPALAAFTATSTALAGSLASDALDPPSGVVAAVSGSDVRLDWTPSPDPYVEGYHIFRSSAAGCCHSLVGSVAGGAATTYLDPGAGGSSEAAFQSVATAVLGSSGRTLTIDTPSGTSPGDVLIGVLTTDTQGGERFSPPSGWTELAVRKTNGGGGNIQTGVWYRVAGDAEPASYTFRWNSNEAAVGAILRYSGVDTAAPVGAWALAAGEDASPTAPSVDTTAANAVILRVMAGHGSDFSTHPAGSTGRFAVITWGSGHITNAGADSVQAQPGATGAAAFSLNSAAKWVALTIALVPERSSQSHYVVQAYSGNWTSSFSNEATPP